MASKPKTLSPIEFQQALKGGHYAKALKALKAGQDIKAALPNAASIPARFVPKPALLAHMWRWEKPERAMEVMQVLLDAGADPNEADSVGRRPLHTWLWLTHAPKPAIQALIKAGANPLYKSIITPNGKEEQSALQVCVFRGLCRELEWMLECIPDLGSRHDQHWEEPIMRNAIQNTREDTPENRQIILALLESGADMDTPDKYGRTARNELMSYQFALIDNWENLVRSKQEGAQLDSSTPSTPARGNLRRM